LRSFVAVAETGGLAAAARRVSRTPSAVSMSLKQLEDTLGGALFEGERKGRLTPLGEHCLAVARRMIGEHDAGLDDMLRFAAGGDGVVRVASVPSAACGLVAMALERHRAETTDVDIGVRIELSDGDSEYVAQRLSSGAADIGIAQLPAEGLGLRAEPLMTEAFAVIFPPEHPRAADPGPVTWEELESGPIVTSPLVESLAATGRRGALRLARARALTLMSVGAAVRAGMGASVVPLIAAERLLPDLPRAPLVDRSGGRTLFAIRRTEDTLSPAAEAFLTHLRRAASALPARARV
jgi:LysR family carnitine catabolism transcriptional activator